MTIKHLVLSGGGPAGLCIYGAIKHLSRENFWSLKDIESIYGSSIGAFLAVALTLNYDWDVLDDYFMKRPWDKVFVIEPGMIIDAFKSKGILDEKYVKECIKYLFTAKDLDENITLKEFYEINKINLYFYTTELNNDIMENIELSHYNNPDLSVITALSMSMAIPFVCKPVCNNGKCYIDGGVLNNFPLKDCITKHKRNQDETLCFYVKWILEENINKSIIDDNSNIIDFLFYLLQQMKYKIDTIDPPIEIKNTIMSKIIYSGNDFSNWKTVVNDEKFRKDIIAIGIEESKLFLKSLEKS